MNVNLFYILFVIILISIFIILEILENKEILYKDTSVVYFFIAFLLFVFSTLTIDSCEKPTGVIIQEYDKSKIINVDITGKKVKVLSEDTVDKINEIYINKFYVIPENSNINTHIEKQELKAFGFIKDANWVMYIKM